MDLATSRTGIRRRMDDSSPDSWWLDCFRFMTLVSGDCRLVRWLLFEFQHFLVDSRCLLVLAQVFCLQPLWCSLKSPQFLLYISLYNHPLTPSTLPLLLSTTQHLTKTREVAPVLEGYDLMDLAPELHSFLSKFHLSAAMMTELLQKQMLGLAGMLVGKTEKKRVTVVGKLGKRWNACGKRFLQWLPRHHIHSANWSFSIWHAWRGFFRYF